MKRLNFITQFKIEFLLQFTGCIKVLGKMPVQMHLCLREVRNTEEKQGKWKLKETNTFQGTQSK